VLYTLGYAMFIGLLINLSQQLLGGRIDLLSIVDAGQGLSGVGHAVLQQTNAVMHNLVSLIAKITLLALWLGTVAFLFFWKRPETAS